MTIKEWFINNNERLKNNDNEKLNILYLYTKASLLKIASSFDLGIIKVVNNKIEVEDRELYNDEIIELKKINNFLGYRSLENLLETEPLMRMRYYNKESNYTLTDEQINEYFKSTLKTMNDYYSNYDLDKEIFINNEYTFFIKKGTNLTKEEKEYLKTIISTDNHEFEVYRINGELVVI